MQINDKFDSLKAIVDNSNQVMVYGWKHCAYGDLMDELTSHPDSFVEKVYSSDFGSPLVSTTLEGHIVEKFNVIQEFIGCLFGEAQKQILRSQCKSGLTYLLLENYKRHKENMEIIPVIFCVDCDANQFPPFTAAGLSSKEDDLNYLITHCELRRVFKHHELINSPHEELRDMGHIANKMYKFVKVTRSGPDRGHIFQKLPALWDLPDVSQALQQRAANAMAKPQRAENKDDPFRSGQWTGQLLGAARRYNVTNRNGCWSRFVRTGMSISCKALSCFGRQSKGLWRNAKNDLLAPH